jgi:hypothetical protein
MGAAISAMVIFQLIAGVTMNVIEVIAFPLFSLFLFLCMILLLKNCTE